MCPIWHKWAGVSSSLVHGDQEDWFSTELSTFDHTPFPFMFSLGPFYSSQYEQYPALAGRKITLSAV